MKIKIIFFAALSISILCHSFPALACTVCDTARAAQVRAAIFGEGFWFNLALTILPFVIFLTITAMIYGNPWKQRFEPLKEMR